MENTVLGDALEGVPEEETEDGVKNKDSNVESAEHVDGEEAFNYLFLNYVGPR
jgi:hypothetical protein